MFNSVQLDAQSKRTRAELHCGKKWNPVLTRASQVGRQLGDTGPQITCETGRFGIEGRVP